MKKLFIFLISFLVLGGVFCFLLYKNQDSSNDTGLNFCTEEALMCPDGSFVSRDSANMCKFSKCPSVDSLEGVFEDWNGEYRLVIASPVQDTHEVSYVLPIHLSPQINLQDFLNKRVVVSGVFDEGNDFMVSSIKEASLSDREVGTVKVGQTVFINGVNITLNKVLADYRCPTDAQCIEAGAINTNVTLKSDTDQETKNMPSDEAPMPFDSFLISIIDINPKAVSTKTIFPDEYEITFKVENSN